MLSCYVLLLLSLLDRPKLSCVEHLDSLFSLYYLALNSCTILDKTRLGVYIMNIIIVCDIVVVLRIVCPCFVACVPQQVILSIGVV